MDKDKSLSHSGGLPPPSGRYSSLSPTASSFNMKSESHHQMSTGANAEVNRFSYDISQMPDNPPKKLGHRRAHSEILMLPDDLSFDSDLGVVGGAAEPSFSDETDEDLMSMFLDMDKLNSNSPPSFSTEVGLAEPFSIANNVPLPAALGSGASSMETFAGGCSERPRVRHQHSQSMDGLSTINSEMLISGSVVDTKKAISADKLAELAIVDPKRAKRIWANRQSAARSKERKMRYISELERKVQTLQTESTTLSAQLTMLQRDTSCMSAENNELKLRLQTTEQQVHLQDALNDALKEEIQHLKLLTGQGNPNGGPVSSFGATQQMYHKDHTMNTLLTAQQLQQLRIHSQKQQIQHHHQQQQQQYHQQQLMHQHEQQQQTGNLKVRGPFFAPGQRDRAPDASSHSAKD